MMDVAILGGGASAEHAVSLRSARAVLAGLHRARWRPWPVFISRDGAWHVPRKPWLASDSADPWSGDLGPAAHPGGALAVLIERSVQVVFPALHGRFGEDGTLQGMLELHRIPFVGSATAASAVGMDKLRTRECLVAHGVPMARAWVGSMNRAGNDAEIDAIEREIGLPCFIKTDVSGSSFGVRRCSNRAELASFFAEEEGRRYVAETPLVGEEISVPVLGNRGETLRPLLPVGIYPRRAAWFTAEAKYEVGGSDEIVPPRGSDPESIQRVQDLAARCHAALGCDGVSRTDMIVTADGPRVLEVNTLPGLTEASLLPKCAAAEGITFPALLDLLLDAALRRSASAAVDTLGVS